MANPHCVHPHLCMIFCCRDLLVLEALDVAVKELVGGKEHGVGDSGACCIDRKTSVHVWFEELDLWWRDGSATLCQTVHLISCLCRVNWID